MARRTTRRLPLFFIAGLAALVFASAAQAASGFNGTAPFGCRASVARVTLGNTLLEPTVANPNTYPCKDGSEGVSSVSVPTNGGSGQVNAGPAGAFTYSAGSAGGTVSPGAAAVASVQGVTIPSSQGLIQIVGPVQADASYECVNNQVVGSASSTLDVVNIQGKNETLPTPGASATYQLGNGAYVAVNEKIQTGNSLEERVLDIHLSSTLNIVVGEAEVTSMGSKPCANTSTGVPPVLEICPPGSTLVPAAQFCEIILPGGGTIIVSRPFKGPSGGTVVPLTTARKKYKSPCLSGAGPKYALIATKRGGRVDGTPMSDRILARGAYERVAGFGGNDCIDGSGGNQRLFDGNGKDRLYASGGYNRVAVGNGNDYINGRNGRDDITAGNGNDTVHGGNGNSTIAVGLGRDHVYGGKGKNHIFAGGDHAFVSCGSGKHNTAFVRYKQAKYAKAHGCQKVHALR